MYSVAVLQLRADTDGQIQHNVRVRMLQHHAT